MPLKKGITSQQNRIYYYLGSLLIGILLGISVLYLNAYLFDMPQNLFFFLLVTIPSVAIIYAAIFMFRIARLEERTMAEHSYEILEITRQTLPFLRKGLNYESAKDVVKIINENTDAIAVAITDSSSILGFCGLGEDHHQVGKPILTRATKEAINKNEVRILGSKAEIGCPMVTCKLRAAIVVPLQNLGKPAGSLKFYYDNPAKLTESRIALAEGLAHLLSTQIELSELDKQRELAVDAELRALQAQINPHFLFNTLNTITSFIRTDPGKARRLLVQFADFFRKSLEWKDGFITLAQELDYVTNYLVFERARFGDRLVVDYDIDPAAQNCILPALTLQPIVENAVKHAFCEGRRLEIDIRVKLDDTNMNITVADNGAGISAKELDRVLRFGYGKGSGIGLSNVNERLNSLYGEEYRVKMESTEGAGTLVSMKIPITRSNKVYDTQNAYRG